MKLVAVWFLLGVLPCSGFAQERAFVTNSRMILGTPEDLTASVTFVDVDGDSDLDAVYANGRHWAQLNEVYLNNGAGQFTVGYALGPEKRKRTGSSSKRSTSMRSSVPRPTTMCVIPSLLTRPAVPRICTRSPGTRV